MNHKFVALPENGKKVHLHKYQKNKKTGKFGYVKVREVLWGDWLKIDDRAAPKDPEEYYTVIWGPISDDPKRLYIKKEHTTDKRPLEIIFLDVGQGDGAVLITPERNEDERIMIIDAGEGDNMQRFINGRFKAYRGFNFDAAILTHPDMDHYLGFGAIFKDHDIGFKTIYHNGLVERVGLDGFNNFGGLTEDPINGEEYIKDLATNRQDIEQFFSTIPNRLSKFPTVMHDALQNEKIKDFKMLSTHSGHSKHENNRSYMPGFAPSDNRSYTIEVLGPVVEYDANNNARLRRIKSYGQTKNGHSVLLRLHFGDFKIFFGGDLNIPAEQFLLKHYTNMDEIPPLGTLEYDTMIQEASYWFGADIMKVCHHGSDKVTDEFIKAVNPACFVISSGDEEGHVHPRPDLLGRLGKLGRGTSPVILSTELQRSTREKEDEKLITQVHKDINEMCEKKEDKLLEQIQENIRILSKTNVDVYGSIYLKTDGERLITAFKIEEKSDIKKWFYFQYKFNDDGELYLC